MTDAFERAIERAIAAAEARCMDRSAAAKRRAEEAFGDALRARPGEMALDEAMNRVVDAIFARPQCRCQKGAS